MVITGLTKVYQPQQLPSLFGFVDVAVMKRPIVLGSITKSFMELKLDDEADEVPVILDTRFRDVRKHFNT